MLTYIDQTVKAIGDVHAWDVVNEAVSMGKGQLIKDSPWSIVDDFICKAFNQARKANPSIKLFYNDYKQASTKGEFSQKSENVYQMVKDLKERDCQVDGVGFQLHIDLTYTDE